jgi:hypothetical protein
LISADSPGVTVPFLDLHAQYRSIQAEVDAAGRQLDALQGIQG